MMVRHDAESQMRPFFGFLLFFSSAVVVVVVGNGGKALIKEQIFIELWRQFVSARRA